MFGFRKWNELRKRRLTSAKMIKEVFGYKLYEAF